MFFLLLKNQKTNELRNILLTLSKRNYQPNQEQIKLCTAKFQKAFHKINMQNIL